MIHTSISTLRGQLKVEIWYDEDFNSHTGVKKVCSMCGSEIMKTPIPVLPSGLVCDKCYRRIRTD